MLGTEHLTNPNPSALSERIAATVSGQATWADLSSSQRCKDCAFFNLNQNKKIPKKSDCAMTQKLARKPQSPKFSRDARACPHFSEREIKRELVA